MAKKKKKEPDTGKKRKGKAVRGKGKKVKM
jgi:hypothetical protein